MCTKCRIRDLFVSAAGCGLVHFFRHCGASPRFVAAGRRDSVSGEKGADSELRRLGLAVGR